MTGRLRDLVGAHPQALLLCLALAHCHTLYDVQNIIEVTCFGDLVDFYHRLLVLLCYKRRTPQKGQWGSCCIRWRAIWMRRVAIDAGLCRSALPRGTARTEAFRERGEAGKSHMAGPCGGGKTVSLCHQETVRGDAECSMMMKSSPAAAFIMS